MNFEEWCKQNKPSVIDEYIPELNGGRFLSEFTESDETRLTWVCKEGHDWETSPFYRRDYDCPICSGKKTIPGVNDLKTLDPILAKQYSPQNPIPVDEISANSHDVVLWNYPCGHSYEAEVKSRYHDKHGCKYCKGNHVLSGFNDLQHLYPKIAEEWDTEKNGKGPDKVRPKSNVPAHWNCSFCGKPYTLSPYERFKRGCPHCGKAQQVSLGEKIVAFYLNRTGFTVLESYHDRDILEDKELDIYLPEFNLAIEYDGRLYHKDEEKDLDKNKLCKRAGIELIRFREIGCPEISGVTTYVVDPKNYDTVVNCVHALVRSINERFGLDAAFTADLKNEIPAILEKIYVARRDKSLGELYPSIAAYKHPSVNINPKAIPCKSNIEIKWRCPDCGYEWSAAVAAVVNSYVRSKRTGCPRCAGKVLIKGVNDAATVDAIAANCWNSERNPDSLSDHFVNDPSIRWWKCIRCQEPFERQIYVMCRKGSIHACKTCYPKMASHKRFEKVTSDGHNLRDEYPKIAQYWDYDANPDRPEDFTPGSEDEKYWICSECGRSYPSRIVVRTRNGGNTTCGDCGRKRGGQKNRINALKDGKNSLEYLYPGLAKEWHPTKNGILKSCDVTPNYEEMVWWHCDKCKQPWERAPATRTRGKGDNGCPYCSGRKYRKGVNDIVTLHSEFVIAWAYDLNEKMPEDYRCNDDTKVYWRCPKCHDVKRQKIREKVNNGTPLCKGCRISNTKSKKSERL